MIDRPKNVSQVIGEIKNLIELEFKNVYMEGEVTNLSLSSSGHWYFNISDKDASISAALFKMDALRNPHIKTIKDGEKLIVSGDINVYPKRGTFQIIVKKIVPIGLGDLKEQFEKLKIKLRNEGLFDLDHKLTIPPMPKRVAIITALRGAALQDFLNIYRRRSLWMDILVVPTLVQGDDSPRAIKQSLINVIQLNMNASADKKIDIIVFARGGGSLEDLWAFNDEALAWEIYNCPIPTISAIGHEVDFTISDFVCDLRAETPSAAAELITHGQTLIKEQLINFKRRMLHVFSIKEAKLKSQLKMSHPQNILMVIQRSFLNYQKRISRLKINHRLNELTHINDHYLTLDQNINRMNDIVKLSIERYNSKLDKLNSILKVTDPENVLSRGYTLIENEKQRVVLDGQQFDSLPMSTKLTIRFHDGKRTVKKL